jgi:hypothetical protein
MDVLSTEEMRSRMSFIRLSNGRFHGPINLHDPSTPEFRWSLRTEEPKAAVEIKCFVSDLGFDGIRPDVFVHT